MHHGLSWLVMIMAIIILWYSPIYAVMDLSEPFIGMSGKRDRFRQPFSLHHLLVKKVRIRVECCKNFEFCAEGATKGHSFPHMVSVDGVENEN